MTALISLKEHCNLQSLYSSSREYTLVQHMTMDRISALRFCDKPLQVVPLLGKVQLCASSGNVTEAEVALTQADSLLDGLPAESAGQWRVHHWLLTQLLQLWKGNGLALQQTGGYSVLLVGSISMPTSACQCLSHLLSVLQS